MNELHQLNKWVKPELKELSTLSTAADCASAGKANGLNDAFSPTTCQS